MTSALVTLALGLALAQHGAPEPAPEAHGAAHGEVGGGHGAGHDENLGAVMEHHVRDGHVLELPGICGGGFRWNCEIDLDHAFGTVRDPETGLAVSGPLVFGPADLTPLGPIDMTPTKHVVAMWIAAAILLAVTLGAVRKRNLVPRGLYNFVELLVAFVRNEIAIKNIGEKDADRFSPYLLTAFFFILFMNLFGLVPWSATATANLSVTVALALFTFFITQYAAIRSMGIAGYLAHLTGGLPKSMWPLWFIMVPVEFLGLFTKPFALTVRLFANMVAGHFVILALLGLMYALGTQWLAFGSVPMALAIFLLELFVALVQAYIFTMLSALFIGAGLVHHGHDEEHEPTGHGPAGAHGSHVAGTAPGHG